LANIAGFNLEFLPPAYFEKSFMMDDSGGFFPLYPNGHMHTNQIRTAEPLPISSGKVFVAAPEAVNKRITVKSLEGELLLYDGRNQVQNGWFVLRSFIPSGKSGKVIEWFVEASTIYLRSDWKDTTNQFQIIKSESWQKLFFSYLL
jgi:endoglucanase